MREKYSTIEQRERWLRSQIQYTHIFRGHKEVKEEERRQIFRDMKRAGLIAPSTYYLDVKRLSVSVK